MKTIKEWISELPEPIRARAMAYEGKNWGDKEAKLCNAIGGAFFWHKSKEGHDYWYLVSLGEYDKAEQLLTPQFKVGDEVQLVRDFGPYKRRKKGVIADYNCGETHFVSFDNKPFLHVPKDAICPHTKSIRPSKSDIIKLRQEISIRNETIDKLEETVQVLQSEKVRLGELNAHLKERVSACEKDNDLLRQTSLRKGQEILDLEFKIRSTNNLIEARQQEQAETISRLAIWKSAAIVAIGINLALGFLLMLK